MRKTITLLLIVVLAVLFTVASVSAITNGEPDNGEHPYVGLMVAFNAEGQPMWRCSGTLMSDTIFLTAGHCTEDPADSVKIWFNEDVDADPGYPFDDNDAAGTPYTHPDYNPNAFYLYDVGVVVLDSPYPMGEYGQLPTLGVVDTLKGKDKKGALTAVGYGLQKTNPVSTVAFRIRLQATLDVLNTRGVFGVPKGTSVAVSGSGVGGDNSDSGGTCFGDSGGPQFLAGTNTVVAVTSFGLNGNCAGTGGGYRIDQPDDLEWLANYLP